MNAYEKYLERQIIDPKVRVKNEAFEPELVIMQAIIDARKEKGMTQKQLADRIGIAQSNISKLETGNAVPSLRTLQRLAKGMDLKIKFELVDIGE